MKGRATLWALLALSAFFNVVALIRALPGDQTGRDFRQLYSAGYMLRTGRGGELYDVNSQRTVQHNLLKDGSGGNIYFIRPAYEALFFAPLSLVSYRWAYFVFLIFNIVLMCVLVLTISPSSIFSRAMLALVILAFLPVSIAVFQGQDSIAIAVIFALCCQFLDSKRPLLAGMLAGVALFKLQVLVPIFLLFVYWKRWRFTWGFGISAFGLSLLSVSITGAHQSLLYLRLLVNVSDQQRLRSYLMPNLRGMLDVLTQGHSEAAVIAGHLVAAGLIAMFLPKPQRDRDAFLIAIPVALLSSYYLFIHDWSVLLLPIVTLLISTDSTTLVFSSGLLLLLLPTSLPGSYFYLLAIPLIAVLLFFTFQQHLGKKKNAGPYSPEQLVQ